MLAGPREERGRRWVGVGIPVEGVMERPGVETEGIRDIAQGQARVKNWWKMSALTWWVDFSLRSECRSVWLDRIRRGYRLLCRTLTGGQSASRPLLAFFCSRWVDFCYFVDEEVL